MVEETELGPCRLLALPRELRDMIYEYTFSSFELYICKKVKQATATAEECNAGLVLTCKQIHAESFKAYYIHSSFATPYESDLRLWLGELPDAARKAVKHVEVKRVVHLWSRPGSTMSNVVEKRIREEVLHSLQDLDVLVEVKFIALGEYLEALESESMGRWI